MKHMANAMSGGQQQRVGIARALVVNPKIIFADEPTGNLDSKTTMEVLKLMQRIVREQNQTLVMVTHDNYIAGFADRQFHIVDGKIQKIEERNADEAGEAMAEADPTKSDPMKPNAMKGYNKNRNKKPEQQNPEQQNQNGSEHV